MLKQWKAMPTSMRWENVVLYLIGVAVMPAGVVLTINAHLGAGGYDALNFAVGEILGINTSLAIYGTATIVLLITAVIRRSWPRVQTFISSFLLGIFTDIWKTILAPVEATGWLDGALLLLLGAIIATFAVACYVRCILPTNPTDDFVVALHEKGLSIAAAKIFMDAICVILAFVLGGEVGVGTILCTFCMGPLVNMFHVLLRKVLGHEDKYAVPAKGTEQPKAA